MTNVKESNLCIVYTLMFTFGNFRSSSWILTRILTVTNPSSCSPSSCWAWAGWSWAARWSSSWWIGSWPRSCAADCAATWPLRLQWEPQQGTWGTTPSRRQFTSIRARTLWPWMFRNKFLDFCFNAQTLCQFIFDPCPCYNPFVRVKSRLWYVYFSVVL